MDMLEIKKFDGTDEIVFSGTFNIYENRLILKGLLGFNFHFNFETQSASEDGKDIIIAGAEKDLTITFGKKFRNTLGSGTTGKIRVVRFQNGKELFLSVYGSVVGDNTEALNITVTFYIR